MLAVRTWQLQPEGTGCCLHVLRVGLGKSGIGRVDEERHDARRGDQLVQQLQPTMPVIGFMNAASAKSYARHLSAYLKGLGETGYVDRQNVAIEYRWAEGENDRLPAMADDLVHRQVVVIAATSAPAALAAKAATTTIPIVLKTGGDPIKLGLVPSLSHPGGNVTGVTPNVETVPKRLQLLHELVPTARVMALLVNPTDPALAETNTKDVQAAARALGLEFHVLTASTS